MSSTTITAITYTKYSWYASTLIVFEFLDIPQMQVWILWCLMILDFITWVCKQFRLDRKLITSYRAWLWAMKKMGTFIIIASLALVLKALELEAEWYLKASVSILIMAEFYSIIQNIYTLRTWKIVPEFDAISIFLRMLWEYVKSKIEKAIDPNKKQNENNNKNT
jgi:phage-related holin